MISFLLSSTEFLLGGSSSHSHRISPTPFLETPVRQKNSKSAHTLTSLSFNIASLCTALPDWPGTYSVNQAGLELTDNICLLNAGIRGICHMLGTFLINTFPYSCISQALFSMLIGMYMPIYFHIYMKIDFSFSYTIHLTTISPLSTSPSFPTSYLSR